MKKINHRKLSIITLFLSAIFLFSCNKDIQDEKENVLTTNGMNKITQKNINDASSLILKSQNGNKTKRNFQEEISPYSEYSELLRNNNMKIIADPRVEIIMDNSYEENLEYLKNQKLITTEEINLADKLIIEINRTSDFEESINNYEKSILNLQLPLNKLQAYTNVIGGLRVLNQVEPNYFQNNLAPSSPLFGSCLSASIGLGIAFVGLATIEVGSFGTATVVAVGGFLWASAEWGAACRKSEGKLHPREKPQEFKKLDDITDPFLKLYGNYTYTPPIKIIRRVYP
jgi:hypothetical protein